MSQLDSRWHHLLRTGCAGRELPGDIGKVVNIHDAVVIDVGAWIKSGLSYFFVERSFDDVEVGAIDHTISVYVAGDRNDDGADRENLLVADLDDGRTGVLAER